MQRLAMTTVSGMRQAVVQPQAGPKATCHLVGMPDSQTRQQPWRWMLANTMNPFVCRPAGTIQTVRRTPKSERHGALMARPVHVVMRRRHW